MQDELQLAIATRRRILPVLLRNTQVSGFLLTIQWIAVVGEEPHAASRVTIMAIETPPAPGLDAAPVATAETLEDLIRLCRSRSTEGSYTNALSVCERVLALDPKNIDVLEIKASVLGAINDPGSEGQALFHILLIDPDDEYLWSVSTTPVSTTPVSTTPVSTTYGMFGRSVSSDFTYVKIFRTLTDEHELLQAFSMLRSSHHWSQRGKLERNQLLMELIEGLKRINRLNALVAMWYSERPLLNTLSDIRTLYMFAEAFMKIGLPDDARETYGLIVHIFENRYGNALRWRFVKRIRDGAFKDDSEAFQLYLASLDALGRTNYAKRLREDYYSN